MISTFHLFDQSGDRCDKCGVSADEIARSGSRCDARLCKYVVLKGVLEDNILDKFYTHFTPGRDPTVMEDGLVAYEVLGYALTAREAQKILGIPEWAMTDAPD